MSKVSHRLDGIPGGEVVPVSDALGAEIRGVNLAGMTWTQPRSGRFTSRGLIIWSWFSGART